MPDQMIYQTFPVVAGQTRQLAKLNIFNQIYYLVPCSSFLLPAEFSMFLLIQTEKEKYIAIPLNMCHRP